ncbi:MAG TPA: hypothetical protein VIA64_07815 [Burkholderiales bacterium]|jgi:hypothetical protein
MWKPVLAALLAGCMTTARAQSCIPPSADSPPLYRALAKLPRAGLRTALDEHAFRNRWTRHDAAVASGFRYGDTVYGSVLEKGGSFDPQATAAWKRTHSRSPARAELRRSLGALADPLTLDRAAVQWLLASCLRTETWSALKPIDSCRFELRAGLQPGAASAPPARPTRFSVRGGRCAAWPERPLSKAGDSVECVRSGNGDFGVELLSDTAEAVRVRLPALPAGRPIPEPVKQEQLSEPVSEVLSLHRTRDFKAIYLGRGCPTCRVYAADVRPTPEGAVILGIVTALSSGAGWHRCPAGLRCGVYEFSPPDTPAQSGCVGLSACRVWRLAETDGEASDVIQLTYQIAQVTCVNCPPGMDYDTARKTWEERTKAEACPVLPDAPAQVFGR